MKLSTPLVTWGRLGQWWAFSITSADGDGTVRVNDAGESDMGDRSGASAPKNAEKIAGEEAGDRRLGETVRLLRQRAGLSIQDVAKRTGLSTGMISQLERALAMPSVRTLRLLSIPLDVPISYFFETNDACGPQRYIVRKNDRRLLRLTASAVVKAELTPP